MTIAEPEGRTAVLAAHAEECVQCRAAPLPTDRIAMLLSATEVGVEPAVLSARALARLRRELRVNRPVAYGAVAGGLLRALLPLPAVAAVDAYMLWLAYSYGATLLPRPLVAYWVWSYAAVLVLLFALTYAALPLFLVRQQSGCARPERGR